MRKTFFVPATDVAGFKASLGTAFSIAARRGGHILAAHVRSDATGLPNDGYWFDESLRQRLEARIKARAEALWHIYENAVSLSEIEATTNAVPELSAEWSQRDGDPVAILTKQAVLGDLTVTHLRRSTDTERERTLRARFLFRSGRPVLFVPRMVMKSPSTVLVAWDGSPQAARAATEAAAFLREAARVHLLAIGTADPYAPTLGDVADYVRRLGVLGDVTTERVNSAAQSEGAHIDRIATSLSADLIVMGAFGRPPWREAMFGGTTREVLQAARVPVLMAH